VDAAAQLLCRADRRDSLDETVGAKAELLDGLATELGFRPPAAVKATKSILDHLARFVLVSELLFDLPSGPPPGLNSVAHADPAHRDRVLALCDRMRDDATLRPGYVQRALAVERELDIPAELRDCEALGGRDTFACQEGQHFSRAVELACAGNLDGARTVIAGRAASIWRDHEDRTLLWKVVERCVNFLSVAGDVEASLLPASASVDRWVAWYTQANGAWRLDQCQRLFEQGEAEAAGADEFEALIVVCRGRYRTVAEKMQSRFLAAVERDGWPPESVQHHTQTFVRAVQPELDRGLRVAYFFVDAMRFEMGRGLVPDLEQDGSETQVTPVATVLPTTTPCGMAALLPGAETSYRLEESAGDAVPSVGGRLMPDSAARMDYMRSVFGDRFGNAPLDDVLRFSTKQLANVTRGKRLFVVRTQDIDGIGESLSGFQARKLMGGVLADLRKAMRRLLVAGFQTFIFIGDHGHVLLPELEHGQQVAKPTGQWLKTKRRSLIGSSAVGAPNVKIMRTSHLGIPTTAPDFAVAPGFTVFAGGETYFHEGISLQECVVPLVVVHARAVSAADQPTRVTLSYRSDRFSSYIISVKATADATLDSSLSGNHLVVRIEAFDGSGPKAGLVGEAVDCDARDPDTKLITLVPGRETAVPVRITDGYAGDVAEVRVTDPDTGKTLAALRLKNAVQD